MNINYREAKESDLFHLVQMLADDQLGAERESATMPLNPAYLSAFKQISNDSNNQLIVVEHKSQIIGMLQLTYIPYLSHMGAWRCLIEAVRIHKDYRGQGIGTLVFKWAIQQARNKNCYMVQLTSNKQRTNAIRFYQQLGFAATHEGFKLILSESSLR